MGYWKDLKMEGQSPRYCFSSDQYKEALRERDFYSRKKKIMIMIILTKN